MVPNGSQGLPMICQECKKNPATYVVSASGQPLSAMVGKRAQLVFFVCDDCAGPRPDNQKLRLAP